MLNDLRLQVILKTVDQATAVLKRIQGGSKSAATSLRDTKTRLKELDDQQRKVARFRDLRTGLEATSAKLKDTEARIKALSQGMHASGPPSLKMIGALKQAKVAAGALAKQQAAQQAQVDELRTKLGAAGISTLKLSEHERSLKAAIEATNQSMAQQIARTKALHDTRTRYHAGMGLAQGVAVKGAVGLGTGYAIARAMTGPIGESKHYITEVQRIASLGLGAKVTADAEAYAKAMKTYGTSTLDNLTLVRDGLSAFADLHHAKMVAPTLARMKFANEAMYGSETGQENEKKFMDMLRVIELRGGLASEAKFKEQANIIQRVITATGGRVQGEEWLNVIKTGGVAAKGLTDEALYYQMEPLVQEMGGHRVGTAMMSAYQNIYQGRTTKRAANLMASLGLIADPSKLKHDKVGQISQLDVGALKGSDIFRHNQFEWMEKVLLPQLAAKGITGQQQILDAMGGIFSNRTASNLFAQMYLQREQIHKNARLNAGADGIDSLYDKARNTPGGAELELVARRNNAYKQLGEAVMPAYTRALEVAAGAMQTFTEWMAANPTAARILTVSLGALAIALIGVGGAMVGLSPLIVSFVALRYGMKMAGIQGTVFSNVLRMGGGALRLVGSILLWLGRLLLLNPIGLAITGIAVAAFAIYKYWGPISSFFSGVWDSIKAGGTALLDWFTSLPSRFLAFGSNIITGLVNGITGALGWLKSSVTGVADNVVGWFKEKLGIKSPSRVFMVAGGHIAAGAAMGIQGGYSHVQRAAAGLAMAAAAAAPSVAMATPLRFDPRPPLSAGASAPAAPAQVINHYEIHIHAAPGMDEQALAKFVRQQLELHEASKRARSRSALGDND